VNADQLRDLFLTYQSAIGFAGINSLLALSVYATLCCGQLSLANAGFMAIGAYAGALLTVHTSLPFAAVLLAGAAAPALCAVPLGLPVLRLRGVFLAIATIGFGEVVRLAFVNWDFTNGALGLVGIPQRTGLGGIYAAVAVALFAFWRLRGTRSGYALEAIREDEAAARTMGIDSTAHKLAMFVLGAAIAGLAGALEAHFTFMVAPSGYAFGRVVDMLVFAVVGGTLHPLGPLVGAAFLTFLPEILRAAGGALGIPPGPLRLFLNGAILLAVILFLPDGVISLRRRAGRGRNVASGASRLAGARREAHDAVAEPGRSEERSPEACLEGTPRGAATRPAGAGRQRSPQQGSRRSAGAIRLEGVRRSFGGVQAVDGVSFAARPGSIHGLIGPNGAGKTTLLNLVSGLVQATGGSISLGGRRIDGLAPHRIAALGVARTYQNIRVFPELSALGNVVVGEHLLRRDTVLDSLLLLPSARGENEAARERARALLARVGLQDRAGERAANLSYGEQRRVEIARALAADPALLLLDEPTAGMNPAEVSAVGRLVVEVARQGRTVLLVEHNVRLVMSVCSTITVLDFGKVIAEGPPAAVASDPAVIAAYLGARP
jgi:branched-chain amino acid transport system permease protein